MTRRSLRPPVRELLAHCIACEGWLVTDPTRIRVATVLSAERAGLVDVERHRGRVSAAVITDAGLAAFPWTP